MVRRCNRLAAECDALTGAIGPSREIRPLRVRSAACLCRREIRSTDEGGRVGWS